MAVPGIIPSAGLTRTAKRSVRQKKSETFCRDTISLLSRIIKILPAPGRVILKLDLTWLLTLASPQIPIASGLPVHLPQTFQEARAISPLSGPSPTVQSQQHGSLQ